VLGSPVVRVLGKYIGRSICSCNSAPIYDSGIQELHCPSSSFLILSLTSLSVIAPGLNTLMRPGLIGLFGLPPFTLESPPANIVALIARSSASAAARPDGEGGAAVLEDPICSHSEPSMVMIVRKSGQMDESRRSDWVASASAR
jgi:hypothetical protein